MTLLLGSVKKIDWYLVFLFVFFMGVWIWAAIDPLYPSGWLLENWLVFIFVPLILIFGYFFNFSKVSWTLITLFLVLHVYASHYTYPEVPFGYILQDWFNSSRNMYDRLAHFSFGFLLAYPIREIFIRISNAKGFWGYYLPFELTLAFSAIYEIGEWIVWINISPVEGLAFIGTQGDLFDPQKDMLVAGIGALIAMIVTGIVNAVLRNDFIKEFVSGFKIKKRPLGEVALKSMINKK